MAVWLLSQSPATADTNDQCSGAMALASGVTNTLSTATATSTNDPIPSCGQAVGKGVWFKVTPSNNGKITVSTCGSDFNTVLAVYSGSCGGLSPLVCDDDGGCGNFTSSVSFSGVAGTTYRIFVGGNNGASGNVQIVASFSSPTVGVTNDLCSGAAELASGVTNAMNTAAATSAGDPSPTCGQSVGKGVWFKVTPLSAGTVTVSTCGSDFDTVLAIYTGACGGLTQIACDDDGGCIGHTSSKSFSGVADTTYYILAGGYEGASGNLQIAATVPAAPPENDLCAEAFTLTNGVTYTVNTATATSTGDPSPTCGQSVGKGVWFQLTPLANGTVTVNTCGSDFDTVLAIFTGDCYNLAQLACDDDGGCIGHTSSKTFSGVANTTYYVLVGGYNGANGNLQITATLPPAPPANDQCAGAVTLTSGATNTTSTTTATSTGDPNPGCSQGAAKGVWYKVTPPSNGNITLSTCGSDFDTVLAIYTGACGSLVQIACDDDGGCGGRTSSKTFSGVAGTTYFVLAGGYQGAAGNLQIVATLPAPVVVNDQCSGALTLTNGVQSSAVTTNATSTGDPNPSCSQSVGKGVWYRITPPGNGTVTVSTCGSDFDTALGVYVGPCGALVPVGCDDDSGCGGGTSSASFSAVAGTTYYILAGGFNGASGHLKITATTPPPLLSYSLQSNLLVLSWYTNTPGFTLQYATELPTTNWISDSNAPSVVGGKYAVTNSITNGFQIFRLKK